MILEWAAFRFLDAYDEEERAWEIYRSPFGNGVRVTAMDSLRWMHRPIKPDHGVFVRKDFDSHSAAMRHIRVECILAGLRHILCFWRKNPK